MSDPKIADAYAEWDDREQNFRVFLTGECSNEECLGCDDCDPPEGLFLIAEHFPENALMPRLYKAAFCANPKDFKDQTVQETLGWDKEAPAKRAAKAVLKELKRIEKGEPGPTNEDIRWALAGVPRR